MNSNESFRILIVEDDRMIREYLEAILKLEGYVIHAVNNGLEALEHLVNKFSVPHLIVLDYMMPIMDGMEFRKTQMTIPQFSTIPVVLLSAAAEHDLKAMEATGVEIIKKPVQLVTLLDKISYYRQLVQKTSLKQSSENNV